MTVRLARPSDLPALTALFAGYCAFYRLDHSRAAMTRFIRARLRDRPRRVWVAPAPRGAAAPLAGFVQVYETISTLALARVWVLNDLFVDESARGSGVGRALIERVIVEARRRGAVRVDLSTQRDNRTAQRLYESLGFTRSNGFVGYSRPV